MVRSVGGTATAPSPGWLLRAAEASCVTTLIAMRAAVLGVTLETVEVTVDSELDDRGMLGMDDAGSVRSAVRPRAGPPHRQWRRRHHPRRARPVGCRSLPRVQRARAPGPHHCRGCDELAATRSRSDAHHQSPRGHAGPRDLRVSRWSPSSRTRSASRSVTGTRRERPACRRDRRASSSARSLRCWRSCSPSRWACIRSLRHAPRPRAR